MDSIEKAILDSKKREAMADEGPWVDVAGVVVSTPKKLVPVNSHVKYPDQGGNSRFLCEARTWEPRFRDALQEQTTFLKWLAEQPTAYAQQAAECLKASGALVSPTQTIVVARKEELVNCHFCNTPLKERISDYESPFGVTVKDVVTLICSTCEHSYLTSRQDAKIDMEERHLLANKHKEYREAIAGCEELVECALTWYNDPYFYSKVRQLAEKANAFLKNLLHAN